jgi:hypothetical protein
VVDVWKGAPDNADIARVYFYKHDSVYASALPKEQKRVRELILQYRDPMLNGAGALAAALMELSLQLADEAVMSGDVIAMCQSYEDLKGYS